MLTKIVIYIFKSLDIVCPIITLQCEAKSHFGV